MNGWLRFIGNLGLVGKLGRDEGKEQGPPPGDGADLGGGTDMEGTAPDELPPRPGEKGHEPDRAAPGGVLLSHE